MEREQTTIRLPVDMRERIQQEADKRDISFNSFINWLLAKALEQINQAQL